MRIEQLEYLTAVVQHGSLRRAADRLHLSQPALSEALGKLERELGVTLLDRCRSGTRINGEGRELLPRMREVLDAVERLRTAADDRRRAGGRVRVGSVHAATSSLLLPAVAAVRRDHPDTDVELVTVPQAEVDAGLLDASLDLGLVNVLGRPPLATVRPGTHRLDDVDLVRGRVVVVLPAAHPLTARPALGVADLRAEPFVAMRAGYVMHDLSARLFGDHQPRVCHRADGAEMGKLLVAEGLGLTLLPDYSVDDDPLLRAGLLTTRPLAVDPAEALVRLVLRRRPGAAAAPTRRLQEALLRLAREYAAPRAS